MRAAFGFLSLLLVLAAVLMLARSNVRQAQPAPAATYVGNGQTAPVPPASQAEIKIRDGLKDAAEAAQRQRDALDKN